MRKDKGMLKGERRINSQSWVEKLKSVARIARERGPREKERWNRGDESRKLII